jgi:hypothetical protein
MIILIPTALVLMFLVWLGRGEPLLARSEWRLSAGLLADAGFVAAVDLAVRGAREVGVVLAVVSTGLLLSTRGWPSWLPTPELRRRPQTPQYRRAELSVEEARDILGVSETATQPEIRAAYTRLMQLAHPDHGGTSGLAAQLIAARDRLLKG